jgi:glycosyltransferase involved in cell wall biosynthesis
MQSVAVIINTFNNLQYLNDAISSVIGQTRKPDEIIVVDDGSTEDPSGIVSKWDGVRLLRQLNQGLATARNTGWKACNSSFVVFLDADDRLRPTAIATNLEQFAKHPECGFVYGSYCFISDNGRVTARVIPSKLSNDQYSDFLSGNPIGMHATVMYRRTCLQEIGGFDSRQTAAEDYDLYIRASRVFRSTCTFETIADYRRHCANMSNNIPLMLTSVLSALRHQKPVVQARQQWAIAYRQGRKRWKRHYAELQLVQLRNRIVRGDSNISGPMKDLFETTLLAPVAVALAAGSLLLRAVSKKLSNRVDFGHLRRDKPFSTVFGFDRGKPVDRHYVERFLQMHSADIRGRVLEIGDNKYTLQFGEDQVKTSEVLNRWRSENGDYFADLSDGVGIPENSFDCIILTQTLHLCFELNAAVATLWRLLRPDGVLLLTVPWVSSIDRGEWGDTWYWSITPAALKRLLALKFEPAHVDIESYGNVLAATAFLYGLAEHEIREKDLDASDPFCPVIVAARAKKVAQEK